MAAVREAVTMISGTRAHVPNLSVYLPKAGRSVSVNSKCEITVGNSKIADAQFLAPDFFVLSSTITGNPKQEKTPTGDFKFLSTALGADTALVFLATVKGGEDFPAIVWEMYNAFGGCPL